MKVYSKKYFVEKIEEFGDHNPIYEDGKAASVTQHI